MITDISYKVFRFICGGIYYKDRYMVRPRLKSPTKQVLAYLTQEELDDIASLVGNQYRSEFIRDAVEAKLNPPKNKQPTIPVMAYLTQKHLDGIKALVGSHGRAKFIRDAIDVRIMQEKNKQAKKAEKSSC